LSSIVIKTS